MSAQLVLHWPEALPAYLLPAAWIHATGVEAAIATPGAGTFGQACRGTVARADLSRHAACEAAAERLMRHGTDLFIRGLGASVGRALGWAPDRRREHEALYQRISAGMLHMVGTWADEPYGCATVARLRRMAQVIDRDGEVAYWHTQPLPQETKKPK